MYGGGHSLHDEEKWSMILMLMKTMFRIMMVIAVFYGVLSLFDWENIFMALTSLIMAAFLEVNIQIIEGRNEEKR